MEDISFPCPSCGIQLKLPAASAGITGPCPRCHAEITAPEAPIQSPAQPPAPTWPSLESPLGSGSKEPLPEFFEDFHGFTDPLEMARHPSVVDPLPPSQARSAQPPAAREEAAVPAFPEAPPPSPPSKTLEPEQTPAPAPRERAPARKRPTDSGLRVPGADAEPAPTLRRGISIAIFILSCLLCICFAFVAGFLVGVKTPMAVPPPIVVPPPDPPRPEPATSDIPQPGPPATGNGVEPGGPDEQTGGTASAIDPLPLDGVPEGVPSPEATLNAFLSAPDWAARNVWVLNGEELAADMRLDAEAFGDGPIETTSVEPLRTVGGAHVYLVCTPDLPRGFPVAVLPTLDEWLVDWVSFNDFHRDSFKRFTEGPTDRRGTFRLLVKPATNESAESLFSPYVLSPPMPERQQVAWVRKGTLAEARLQTIFESRAGYSEEDFSNLMKQAGPPLIISLYKGENSQGDHFFQIDEIKGIGWIPELP